MGVDGLGDRVVMSFVLVDERMKLFEVLPTYLGKRSPPKSQCGKRPTTANHTSM